MQSCLIADGYGDLTKRRRNRDAGANSPLGAFRAKARRADRLDQATGAGRASGGGSRRRQNNQPTTARLSAFHAMPSRKAMR